MPPAAGVVIGAVAVGVGAGIAGASIGVAIGLAATSLALGFVQQALAPKVKAPSISGFASRSQERTQMIRRPITSRRYPFGEIVMGGSLTFYESTEDNKFHHMVVTVGDAPVFAWRDWSTVWFNDEPIYPSQVDSGGNITTGKFADKVRLKVLRGGSAQEADPDIVSEIDRLNGNFRGSRIAYIYARIEFDRDLFPNGLPSIRGRFKTNRPLDPRTGTRKFTGNIALILREYLTDNTLGLGYTTSDDPAVFADLSEESVIAAANVCDEILDARPVGHVVVVVNTVVDTLGLSVRGSSAPVRFVTGDRVQLFTAGVLPGGLSEGTQYFVSVERLVGVPFESGDTITVRSSDYTGIARTAIIEDNVDKVDANVLRPIVTLHTSLEDALEGSNRVSISDGGSGQHLIIKTGEPRYHGSGVIELDQTPKDIIDDLLTGMAGRLVWTGGRFRMIAGAFTSSVLSLDENDLMGQLTVRSRHSRRDRFNSVKGLIATPIEVGETTDYPPVIDTGFIEADGGQRIFNDADKPFTDRPSTAQRLAKIDLARHRRELAVEYPTTLRGLMATPGSVVDITNTRRGWDGKTFEVVDWEDFTFGEDDPPVQGVKLFLRETDETVFEFDPNTDETIKPPRATPPGGNPFNVHPPGIPILKSGVEELIITESTVIIRLRVTWDPSPDGLADEHEVQFKPSSSPTWQNHGRFSTPISESFISDLTPDGFYDVRVRARNVVGGRSSWSTKTGHQFATAASSGVPSGLVGLTISVSGGSVLLRWQRPPEIDVLVGGEIRFRHSSELIPGNATWGASTSIGTAAQGRDRLAVLPLKGGTYLARVYNRSGVRSDDIAKRSTKQANVIPFFPVNTVTEHPTFGGTHNDTEVVSDDLRLDDNGLSAGQGTYEFLNGFDFTNPRRVRLTTDITVASSAINDLISSRTTPISTWESISGADEVDTDVIVEVRTTDDDPGGSPVWSEWDQLDSTEIENRAAQFRAILTTADSNVNIFVSELSIRAEEFQ